MADGSRNRQDEHWARCTGSSELWGGRRPAPDLHAVLVGIDRYLPNRLLDGSSYPSLRGCVRDVEMVEALLREGLEVPEERIVKLTSTNLGTSEPPESRDRWPTYENLVAALKGVCDRASPGDQVLLHYSGHGGRARTTIPEIKGETGKDECLVPLDIGDRQARYLRDTEVAVVLRRIVGRGLFAVLVLDCCHSGGAIRGDELPEGLAVRGIATADLTQRTAPSLIADPEELAETWAALHPYPVPRVRQRIGRDLAPDRRCWYQVPEGYVLLAACRPSERAYEGAFDGVRASGALTHWFLKAVAGGGPGLTYRRLHDLLVAEIHSRFPSQTPQLEGEADRLVFDREEIRTVRGVTVLEGEDRDPGTMVLATGQAQGLRRGARLAVYSGGASADPGPDERLALVEIVELGATKSRARVFERLQSGIEIRAGDQALPVDRGGSLGCRRVRLARQELSSGSEGQQVLSALEASLAAASGCLELSRDSPAAGGFLVGLSPEGAYEIRDSFGNPMPNLPPALHPSLPWAAARTTDRLVQLANYRAVQQLQNHDPDSRLRGALSAELGLLPADYLPGTPLRPTASPQLVSRIRPTDWICITIRNLSEEELNLTILDLQPSWSIVQVFPAVEKGAFHPLEPQTLVRIPLQVGLPDRCRSGIDVLKVFATAGPTSFRWLELPPLEAQGPSRGPTRDGSPSRMAQVPTASGSGASKVRDLSALSRPSSDWIAETLEVLVVREHTHSL